VQKPPPDGKSSVDVAVLVAHAFPSSPVFPKKKRLPRAIFQKVLNGRRVSSMHFSAAFSNEYDGYAVIVPKKVARLSVTRHRIKRRVLEALRKSRLPASSLVLFPKQTVATLPYKEVEEELKSLLSKIH
jgi:ribonuclease P protein component